VIGFEYQMVDGTSNSDATRGGALYDVIAPSMYATKPAGLTIRGWRRAVTAWNTG